MVILEFTNDRIKLVEAVKKGQRLVLSTLAKKSINGMSDEAVSGAISDLIKESGIKKINSLVISIPRHLVTVRNLRLPSVEDMELRDMVNLQAGKLLPYAASELVWDFRTIEKRPDGYSDVFLAMGHRNVIDRFTKILADCKLTADRVILSSEALFGWFLAACGPGPDDEAAAKTGAVIDIDSSHINIVIVHGGRLEFSRSFVLKNDPEEMAEEIRKTFTSHENDASRKVSSIILTGTEEKAVALKPFIEAIYKGMRIDFIHSFKIVSDDYREMLEGYMDASRDVSFAAILGIGYNFKDIMMDFLPPEEKIRVSKAKKRRMLIKTAILLSAIVLLLLGILIKNIIDIKEQLGAIDLKIKASEPKVKKLREISQNIEVIKQNLDMKGSSVDVIREVYKIVVPGVSISVMDFELGASLTLRGVSTDMSSVFKFSSELEKSPYFKKCQIKYAQKRVVKAQELVDFELSCELNRLLK